MTRWLRTPAAAGYVGLAASTLEKLRVAGGGPIFHKLGRKVVVYDTNDLDVWPGRRKSTADDGLTSDQEPPDTSDHKTPDK